MGQDPATFIANLSLYSCEHQFQANLCKQDYSAAKQNNNNSRFIDDINILNNQHFEDQIRLIYPPEITCNRENLTDISGHFLEIDISIESEKFRTKIFDKRDDFSFDIVKYPDTKSNIPDSIVYCKDIGSAGYVRAVKAVLPGVSKRAQANLNPSSA